MQTKNYENLQLKTIEVKLEKLMFLVEKLCSEKNTPQKEVPEFLNLEQAAALKGGCAYDTVKTRYWLQPCCGVNSKKIGGRKCWNRKDVFDWLKVDDKQLPEYAKKYGVKIPA